MLKCGCGNEVKVFDQGRTDVDWRVECSKCFIKTGSWGSKSAAIAAFETATSINTIRPPVRV